MKDRFYYTLFSIVRLMSRNNKIILLGDFNSRVGWNRSIWQGVICHHGTGNTNSIRPRLLCPELDMHMTSVLDFLDASKVQTLVPIQVRNCHAPKLHIMHVRRLTMSYSSYAWGGFSTDHDQISLTLQLTVRPPTRRQKAMRKRNVKAAHAHNIREKPRSTIVKSLSRVQTTATLKCISNFTYDRRRFPQPY